MARGKTGENNFPHHANTKLTDKHIAQIEWLKHHDPGSTVASVLRSALESYYFNKNPTGASGEAN